MFTQKHIRLESAKDAKLCLYKRIPEANVDAPGIQLRRGKGGVGCVHGKRRQFDVFYRLKRYFLDVGRIGVGHYKIEHVANRSSFKLGIEIYEIVATITFIFMRFKQCYVIWVGRPTKRITY